MGCRQRLDHECHCQRWHRAFVAVNAVVVAFAIAGVIAGAAIGDVVAVAAVNHIISVASKNGVVALACVDGVISSSGGPHAGAVIDLIRPGCAVQGGVVARGAEIDVRHPARSGL